MSRTQLVIFDCDGVLVDSEPVANRTLGQMLRELGLDFTQEQIFQNFVGYSLPHCMRVIEGMLGRAPPENFLRDLQARTFAAFKTELRAMPGIEDALDRLHVPFCVASSGDHEKMKHHARHHRPAAALRRAHLQRHAGRARQACSGRVPVRGASSSERSRSVRGRRRHAAWRAGRRCSGNDGVRLCAHTPEHKLKAAGAHRTFTDLHVLRRLVSGRNVSD